TRGRFSTMSKELVESLPSLRKLTTGCRLRQEVRNRTLKEASFIDYRGGRREPDLYLPMKLKFGDAFSERCTGCSVRYVGDLQGTTASFELTHTGEHQPFMTITVKADAEVIVRNRPENPSANMQHFSLVYDIYKDCKNITLPPPPLQKCNRRNC